MQAYWFFYIVCFGQWCFLSSTHPISHTGHVLTCLKLLCTFSWLSEEFWCRYKNIKSVCVLCGTNPNNANLLFLLTTNYDSWISHLVLSLCYKIIETHLFLKCAHKKWLNYKVTCDAGSKQVKVAQTLPQIYHKQFE